MNFHKSFAVNSTDPNPKVSIIQRSNVVATVPFEQIRSNALK